MTASFFWTGNIALSISVPPHVWGITTWARIAAGLKKFAVLFPERRENLESSEQSDETVPAARRRQPEGHALKLSQSALHAVEFVFHRLQAVHTCSRDN